MTETAVAYDVSINGVLPGKHTGEVVEAVAPVLGLLPSDAVHLFNGIAHTVLQRADLSAAASFQAELKALGIDASVAVHQEKRGAAQPAEAVSEENTAELVEEVALDESTESLASEFEAAEDAPAAPANETATDVEVDDGLEVELDDALLSEAAETAADAPELTGATTEQDTERKARAMQKAKAHQKARRAKAAEQQRAKAAAAKAQASAASDAGIDATLDSEVSPVDASRIPIETAATVANSAGTIDPDTLVSTPIRRAEPGSNMLCMSCNTLQPRAPQCPGCGADMSAPSAAPAKPSLPPQLPNAALIAATGAALVSAGIWFAVAQAVAFDAGFFAIITGGLAGLACGLLGGRGVKSGGATAVITLLAIAAVYLMLPTEAPPAPQAPPQPDPAEVWSEEQAPARYAEALEDAETFMTIDGSAEAVREFMVQHKYTLARKAQNVPQGDQRYFYDVDAADLTWIVRNQPDFAAWRQRMQNHLSGRQRAALGVSTPLAKRTAPAISALQLGFTLAGLAAAFILGMIGLKRSKG